MAIKITWKEFLDFSDDAELNRLYTELDRIESTFTQAIKDIGVENNKLKKSLRDLGDEADIMVKGLTDLTVATEANQKALNNAAKKAEDMAKADAKLTESVQENEKAMTELGDAVDKVKKAKDGLEKANKLEEGSLAALKQELREAVKQYELMGNATDQSVKDAHLAKIKELSVQVNNGNKAVTAAKKAVDHAAGSYGLLNKEVSEAKKRLKEMENGMEGNSEEAIKLKKFIKDGTDQLKEFDKGLGDNQREVGNYSLAVEKLDQRFGGMIGNVKAVGSELMALASNPFLLTIAAIVAAIALVTAAVKTFFNTTGEGEDVAARQAAVWGQFANVIKMGFADIGEGVGTFLEDMGGLKVVIDKSIGFIHKWIRAVTIVPVTLLGMGDAVDKFFENIRKRFNETADDAVKLADDMDALDERIRAHIVQQAKDELRYNDLIERSKNKVLYSDQQRLAFLQEAVKIQAKMSEDEIAIEKTRLAQLEKSIALATKDPTDDQRKEIAEQTAKIIQLEGQLFADRKRNTAQISALMEEIEKAERDRIARRMLAEQELNKLITNDRIKTAQEDLKNKNLTFEEEKGLLEFQAQERLRLMQIERDQAIGIVTAAAEERIRAEGKSVKDNIDKDEALKIELLRIQEKYNMDSENLYDVLLTDIEKSFLSKLEQGFRQTFSQISTSTNAQLTELNKRFVEQGGSFEKFEEEKARIIRDGQINGLNEQLSFLEEQIKVYEKDADKRIELEEKVAQVKRELSDIVTQHYSDNRKKTEAEEKAFNEKLIQFTDQAAGEIMNLLDASFAARTERNVAHLEGELAQEEEKKNKSLAIAGDDAQARALIEQDFANKKAAIDKQIMQEKRKQAIFQKGLDATAIVLSTAKGIAAAVAASPLTFGLPWSAFVGVIGALQLATVLARPIPQFYKGTESAPGGLAWVAEQGREIAVSPRGDLKVYDKKQVANVEKGTKIIPNWKSEMLLRDAKKYGDGYMYDQLGLSYRESSEGINSPELVVDMHPVKDAIDTSTREITRAIKSQPQSVYDEKGFRQYERSENGRVNRLDSKYKLQ